MPTKNALIVQTIRAFVQGCGSAEIDDAACDWFFERYYPWIDEKKTNPRANGTSPQDVWDQQGTDFLGRFRQIGANAAAKGSPIQAQTLTDEALAVEQSSESDCPWCPLQP
jgi:hypothetical protein